MNYSTLPLSHSEPSYRCGAHLQNVIRLLETIFLIIIIIVLWIMGNLMVLRLISGSAPLLSILIIYGCLNPSVKVGSWWVQGWRLGGRVRVSNPACWAQSKLSMAFLAGWQHAELWLFFFFWTFSLLTLNRGELGCLAMALLNNRMTLPIQDVFLQFARFHIMWSGRWLEKNLCFVLLSLCWQLLLFIPLLPPPLALNQHTMLVLFSVLLDSIHSGAVFAVLSYS